MSVNRVQLLSLLSVKRVCFGKLQTSLCINFYIEAHPPGVYCNDINVNMANICVRNGSCFISLLLCL